MCWGQAEGTGERVGGPLRCHCQGISGSVTRGEWRSWSPWWRGGCRGLCPQCRNPSPCRWWAGGWQGAAHPQSQAGLAGEVLEDALVRIVVAVVVVGQDACIVGTLHVPAQRCTGALWGWQSVGWIQTPYTLLPPTLAQPVPRSDPPGGTQLPVTLGLLQLCSLRSPNTESCHPLLSE